MKNLLHKDCLEDFKKWCVAQGIEVRVIDPPVHPYELCRVHASWRGTDQWDCVYSRERMPVHVTVTAPLVPLVRRFIKERRKRHP